MNDGNCFILQTGMRCEVLYAADKTFRSTILCSISYRPPSTYIGLCNALEVSANCRVATRRRFGSTTMQRYKFFLTPPKIFCNLQFGIKSQPFQKNHSRLYCRLQQRRNPPFIAQPYNATADPVIHVPVGSLQEGGSGGLWDGLICGRSHLWCALCDRRTASRTGCARVRDGPRRASRRRGQCW